MRAGALVFNGRFLTAPRAGVQRVAEELIKATDEILSGSEAPEGVSGVMVVPRKGGRPVELRSIPVVRRGVGGGVLWEQLNLPRWQDKGLLINLANSGPIQAHRSITMIHDAQVFDTPESYSWKFRAWYNHSLRAYGRNNIAILTVSNWSKRRLIAHEVAPAEKVCVVNPGVDHIARVVPDPNVLKERRLAPRKYVLGLAALHSHKNVKVLIETFARREMARLSLALFGGASQAQLEAAVGRALPPNVVLLGRVQDGALRGLLDQALCLAFPSTTEGFGLPPLEAMYIGCPAVVAPCGALPEVCGAGASYAPPHDPASWAVEFLRLAEDERVWATQSQKGRKAAASFTWVNSARRLLEVATTHASEH